MKKEAKDLETILVIVAGLLVFYFLFKLEVLITISLALLVLSLASKFLRRQIAWLWMKLSEGLGWINSKILLSVIFYVFLFPIAMLFKLFNKDNLMLKKNTETGYYKVREHEYTAEDIENPW